MADAFAALAGRAVKTAAGRSDSRARLVRAVRAACRRQGIGDEDRKAIQLATIGKASLADMDLPEIGRLLDRLNRGWKGTPQSSGYFPHRAHVGKIRALWWTLYWLGAVHEPNEPALNAFVERQAKVAALRFLDHKKAYAVIEALKSWAAREGVVWPAGKPDANDDRRAVLAAIWAKLAERGVVAGGRLGAYVAAALGADRALERLDSHELDALIRQLGKRLRRELGKREGGE